MSYISSVSHSFLHPPSAFFSYAELVAARERPQPTHLTYHQNRSVRPCIRAYPPLSVADTSLRLPSPTSSTCPQPRRRFQHRPSVFAYSSPSSPHISLISQVPSHTTTGNRSAKVGPNRRRIDQRIALPPSFMTAAQSVPPPPPCPFLFDNFSTVRKTVMQRRACKN